MDATKSYRKRGKIRLAKHLRFQKFFTGILLWYLDQQCLLFNYS